MAIQATKCHVQFTVENNFNCRLDAIAMLSFENLRELFRKPPFVQYPERNDAEDSSSEGVKNLKGVSTSTLAKETYRAKDKMYTEDFRSILQSMKQDIRKLSDSLDYCYELCEFNVEHYSHVREAIFIIKKNMKDFPFDFCEKKEKGRERLTSRAPDLTKFEETAEEDCKKISQ